MIHLYEIKKGICSTLRKTAAFDLVQCHDFQGTNLVFIFLYLGYVAYLINSFSQLSLHPA